MVNLYAIFHLNLNFSLVDESEWELVVSKCYWPLVDIARKNRKNKIAIELSGSTLEKLDKIDPGLIREIKRLIGLRSVEIIASGQEQIISPLVPYQITLKNLAIGLTTYKNIFGVKPKIAYINEQTVSDGLIDVYKKAGFRSIIVDWDNLPEASKIETIPYQPINLQSQSGTNIGCIFISSVAMGQFRRAIFGESSQAKYNNFLEKTSRGLEYFPIYGDDVEIYDFNPSSLNLDVKASQDKNFAKISLILNKISSGGNFRFVLPRDLNVDRGTTASLTDAMLTVRTKKQEKYNASRWAVCGRNNSRINTACHRIFTNLRISENILTRQGSSSDKQMLKGLFGKLVHLWSSDFRSHTTEYKMDKFMTDLGWTSRESENLLARLIQQKKKVRGTFRLKNTNTEDWGNGVLETIVELPVGVSQGKIGVEVDGKKVVSQIEDAEFYSDGSIRRAKLVFRASVPKNGEIPGRFIFGKEKTSYDFKKTSKVKTKSVNVDFWPQKGSAIESLVFPGISKQPLCGTLKQGHYLNPKLNADWFTGHTIIRNSDNTKLTDLEHCELVAPSNIQDFPIRLPLIGKTKIGNGEVVKKYFVYVDEPRVDIEKHFYFYSLSPVSFRNFNLTLVPDSFDNQSLYIATVNGGTNYEKFNLGDLQINQDEMVNLKVSSHGCQGATEGWVAIGDSTKGVAVISKLNDYYSVPLIHYENNPNRFFGRISISIAESDETAAHFFRGKFKLKNAILGYKKINEVELNSAQINNPLLFIY
jgi:hypothetical protein